MNRLACFAAAALEGVQGASVVLAWVIIAVLLTVSLVGTPLVMALYRWRVNALMRERSAQSESASPDLTIDAGDPSPRAAAPVPDAATLVDAVGRRLARQRRVLVVACAVYALLASAVLTLSPIGTGREVPLPPPQGAALWALAALDLVLVAALCTPLVLIGIAHPRLGRIFWRRVTPVLLLAAAGRFAVAESLDPQGTPDGAFIAILVLGAQFVGLLYIAVARRHARQVVPMLTVLLGALAAGVVAIAVLGEGAQTCLEDHWLGDVAWLSMPVVLLGGLWGAARAVRGLGTAFERKRVSESQVQTAAWLLTLSALVLALASGFGDPRGPWAPALAAATMLAYLAYRLATHRQQPWTPPVRLLLLRVFARDDRGERLLDELAFRWRFIGPIQMIGGPDMAQQTLDPHELLLFLRWRLRDQFVASAAVLRERLAQLDLAADPDGRYRVNEFFCLDSTWKDGVTALLSRSEVVLLDLRGFTADRLGTGFEIGLLAQRRAMRRTVCLLDERTDRGAAERLALAGGGRLDDARLLDVGRELDADDLLRALADAAAQRA